MGRFFSLLLVATVCLTGCQQKIDSKFDGKNVTKATNASSGQQLFLTHCATCHLGAGDPPGPNAIILNSSSLDSEVLFRELLRHPSSAMMPAFDQQTLGDGPVHELYMYLGAEKSKK